MIDAQRTKELLVAGRELPLRVRREGLTWQLAARDFLKRHLPTVLAISLALITTACNERPSPQSQKHLRIEVPATPISKPPELEIPSAVCRQYDYVNLTSGRTDSVVFLRLVAADRVQFRRKLRIRIEIETSDYTFTGYVGELGVGMAQMGQGGYFKGESVATSGDENFDPVTNRLKKPLFARSLEIPQKIIGCRYEITTLG